MKRIFRALLGLSLLWLIGGTAVAEVAVIGNAKATVGTLTAEQISQVFLGTSNDFKPVDQAEGAPIRTEFYKKVADKDAAQVKAIWSRLAFTGKGRPPKEYGSSADVKKAVSEDARSIGYIEKSAVDASVKVLLLVP
jgi:ABC-type phosphate transport system substrate-binding protein